MSPKSGTRTSTIGELLEVLIDYRGKTPPKTPSGVPLITAKVIKGGRITSDRSEFISEDTYDSWMRRGLPKPGDVLITTEAPLGEVAQVGFDAHIALAQRVILLRPDPSRVDPQFFFHFLRSPIARDRLSRRSSGTTVSGIRQPELRAVEIDLLDRDSQERVGQILDAVDDLLENNRRRIEILEEMAQAIYREWFVHFRFPGHETATFVDSPLGPIPEDWRVESIARVCKRIQSGGTPKRSESSFWLEGTVDWYKTGDLTDSVLLGSSERISSVAVEYGGARIFEPETILMAIYGSPTVGRLGLVREASSANQAALGLVANDDVVSTVFLWFSLRQQRDYFNQIAQGAAQQNISKKKVADALILVPASTIVSDFSLAAESAWRLSHELARQNTALESARDLLLPKLVSGEIDVSDLTLRSCC